jgi:3-hydroxymyristoyl/3-hydroxydecanoyl-(acyl carrier protein) dehydratase
VIAFPLGEPARDGDGWRIEVEVPADTEYVRGHFPGEPILPAVAQLALVAQAAAACWRTEVDLSGLVDVRFRAPVVPGDRLRLRLSPAERAGELRFRLTRGDALVSQGVVSTRGGAGDG